jgi:hypothetical protein
LGLIAAPSIANGVEIQRANWPKDRNAETIVRGAVTPMMVGDYSGGTVAKLMLLAPTSAASKLFELATVVIRIFWPVTLPKGEKGRGPLLLPQRLQDLHQLGVDEFVTADQVAGFEWIALTIDAADDAAGFAHDDCAGRHVPR